MDYKEWSFANQVLIFVKNTPNYCLLQNNSDKQVEKGPNRIKALKQIAFREEWPLKVMLEKKHLNQ